MASEFVGVIVGMDTKIPWRFIDPQNDSELDDPILPFTVVTGRYEPMRVVRIPRQVYEMAIKPSQDPPRDLRYVVDLILRQENQDG